MLGDSRSMLFAAAMLLGISQVIFSADTKKEDRDTSFDACDVSTDDSNITQTGNGLIWEQSNDPNFFLAPGKGACGNNYTDVSAVVCLKPGWIKSAHQSKCNSWVQVYSPESGVVTQGIVWDSCGAVANSTFGCNDIYVSKRMFEKLAGNNKEKALDVGRLPGQLQWRFTTEPCWACAAGIPGMYPNGTADHCVGRDSMGYTRCGRRSGENRIIGPSSNFVCSQQVDTCEKVEEIAKAIPKYHGKPANATASKETTKDGMTKPSTAGSEKKPTDTKTTPTSDSKEKSTTDTDSTMPKSTEKTSSNGDNKMTPTGEGDSKKDGMSTTPGMTGTAPPGSMAASESYGKSKQHRRHFGQQSASTF